MIQEISEIIYDYYLNITKTEVSNYFNEIVLFPKESIKLMKCTTMFPGCVFDKNNKIYRFNLEDILKNGNFDFFCKLQKIEIIRIDESFPFLLDNSNNKIITQWILENNNKKIIPPFNLNIKNLIRIYTEKVYNLDFYKEMKNPVDDLESICKNITECIALCIHNLSKTEKDIELYTYKNLNELKKQYMNKCIEEPIYRSSSIKKMQSHINKFFNLYPCEEEIKKLNFIQSLKYYSGINAITTNDKFFNNLVLFIIFIPSFVCILILLVHGREKLQFMNLLIAQLLLLLIPFLFSFILQISQYAKYYWNKI